MKPLFELVLLASTIALAAAALVWPGAWWGFLLLGPVDLIVIYDLAQRRHTILRNYPLVGHLRYMLEDIHAQIRQYLIESDLEGNPFSREQRAMVYQRAKNASNVHPFGTIENLYSADYEWIDHSIAALEPAAEEPRVRVGNSGCSQPYEASHLNISAMSFGALSRNAILALNAGARAGGFAHDTGEGGMSAYHLQPGGDLIWELGTGYFGCRTKDGHFDPDQFCDKARLANVKMVEIKVSQGAKPGGGGILPGAKVSSAIAAARGVPAGKDVHSPAAHSAFSTPREMVAFMARLRELSGGKPVGFKLCVGRPEQFLGICKAMLDSDIYADFIVVDGGEGGTGAAPQELSDSMGRPLRDGLIFVHNALVGTGLREHIRVIASGKIISGFDIAAKIAMGADMCNSARGMMLALGCIQARRCHTNTCPSGVATQGEWRQRGLVVADKSVRVANFHRNTIQNFLRVLAAAGLTSPDQLRPEMLRRRTSGTEVSDYRQLFHYLEPGDIVAGRAGGIYAPAWAAASADSF